MLLLENIFKIGESVNSLDTCGKQYVYYLGVDEMPVQLNSRTHGQQTD